MPPPTNNRKPADPGAASKTPNEYIPNFIAKKPFYVADDSATSTTDADYLEHQRLQSSADAASASAAQKWYDRGKKLGPAATKFRKGACENCGALTHKTKECLSRPRKAGAKWTGRDIQADEVVQDVKLGWDAKRDRWNGYDAREYDGVVRDFNTYEEMKRRMNGNTGAGQKAIENGEPAGDADDTNGKDTGDRYEEETDMGRHQSTSTRNLRIREDTAKYLLDLDLESARYDPKTRSMVDSGATADQTAALVAEEGFVKKSGDAAAFEDASRAAWEMQERGDKNRIHLQANPSAAEFYRKKEAEEAKMKKEEQRKLLAAKYGGQEHLLRNKDKLPAVVESETFVEYDERGKIKGAVPTKTKSSYPEDVMINNHTSIWGSWWKDFQWGYACCHSTTKNSYCTGEEGKLALESEELMQKGLPQAQIEEVPKEIAWKEEEQAEARVPNGKEDRAKAKPDKAQKRSREEMESGVTDEQMEEYRRKRMTKDDPMAAMLGKDELVH